jgi:hypothetical protein
LRDFDGCNNTANRRKIGTGLSLVENTIRSQSTLFYLLKIKKMQLRKKIP